MAAMLEVRGINKYYGSGENRVHVLKNISLRIDKGDFVAIIGQSGSGKSTLMNILGCLDQASDGDYLVDGVSTSQFSPDDFARLRSEKFGFIFQRYNLLASLTARDNVALPAIYAGTGKSQRNAKADELLVKLGLDGKTQNRPGELSGGQQQRVSIARALVKRPKLILADEPTAALDYTTSIEVLSVIEDIVKHQGTTVMMVTHNAEIAKMADRVVKVRNGKIASIKKNMHPLHAQELVW